MLSECKFSCYALEILHIPIWYSFKLPPLFEWRRCLFATKNACLAESFSFIHLNFQFKKNQMGIY